MGARVLIVDDNPANLTLLAFVLRTAGHDVETASSAEDGLASLERATPDLLVVDVQLPGMDGLTMTRTLRADPRWRDLKIVAVTAQAMRGDREAALAAGCDAYVSKPIDTRGLPRTIAAVLAGEPT
jgi:CheY-like chemotaxis protein